MTDDGCAYAQAHKLRRDWLLWTCATWARITSVRVTGDHVLITVEGGQVYRAGYTDAVLYRKTPPAPLAATA